MVVLTRALTGAACSRGDGGRLGAAGAGELGRLHEQAGLRERQLTEGRQVEDLADRQRVDRGDEHALEPLAGGVTGREVQRGGRRQVRRGALGAHRHVAPGVTSV